MFSIRRFRRRTVIATVGAFALIGSLGRDASACGGEWGPVLIEPDYRPRAIPLAEKALDEGRTVAAAGIVIRVIPHIRKLEPTSSPIVARAHRVLALAIARHRGALPIEREVPSYARGAWSGKNATERGLNLRWAVSTMQALAKQDPSDPAIETDLAEVLAQLPEHREDARARLERLAKHDLIVSAEGYAILAELRGEAGDVQGRTAALVRCRAMARAEASCPAPAGESAS